MTARETTEVSKLLEAGTRSKSFLYVLHSFSKNSFSLTKYTNKKFSSGSNIKYVPVIIKKKGFQWHSLCGVQIYVHANYNLSFFEELHVRLFINKNPFIFCTFLFWLHVLYLVHVRTCPSFPAIVQIMPNYNASIGAEVQRPGLVIGK